MDGRGLHDRARRRGDPVEALRLGHRGDVAALRAPLGDRDERVQLRARPRRGRSPGASAASSAVVELGALGAEVAERAAEQRDAGVERLAALHARDDAQHRVLERAQHGHRRPPPRSPRGPRGARRGGRRRPSRSAQLVGHARRRSRRSCAASSRGARRASASAIEPANGSSTWSRMAGKRSPALATGSPGAWCTYSAAPWSISHRPWCQRSRLGLRGVRSTLSTKRVEPHDVGGQLGLWRALRRERQRAGQEVHAEVDPAAGGDQLLDLGVGLGGAQRGVELHRARARAPAARARAPTSPATISAASAFGPLAGAAELEHVQPVVVGLHQPGHRSALPQRGHVAGRGHGAEHAGIMAGHGDEAVGAAGGAGRERADDDVHALARPGLRDLRRPVAVLRRGPRGVLGLDLGVLRGRLVLRRGARQARDARRGVVQGRRGQLRRARVPGQGRRRAGDRPRGRAARPGRAHVGRAARAGRGDRGRAEGAGRRARRPRGGVHAEHPGGDRGVPRHRLDRRRVVELLAGLRRAQRRRPLRADRAEGAAGGRRLPLQRQGLRPHGDGRRDPRRGRRRAGAARLPRRLRLAGRLPRRRRAGVRARAVRPPAVGPLLVRHHRAAEGDRPGPGRDPHRAPQEAPPPRGRCRPATASSGSPRPAG